MTKKTQEFENELESELFGDVEPENEPEPEKPQPPVKKTTTKQTPNKKVQTIYDIGLTDELADRVKYIMTNSGDTIALFDQVLDLIEGRMELNRLYVAMEEQKDVIAGQVQDLLESIERSLER